MRPSLTIPAIALGSETAVASSPALRSACEVDTTCPPSVCGVKPGIYAIYGTSTVLRSGGYHDQIFVAHTKEDIDPGPFGLVLTFYPLGSCDGSLSCVTGSGTSSPRGRGEIGFGDTEDPVALTISAVNEDSFSIGVTVANEDKFWTVDPNPVVSIVTLESESEGGEQSWWFQNMGCPVASEIDEVEVELCEREEKADSRPSCKDAQFFTDAAEDMSQPELWQIIAQHVNEGREDFNPAVVQMQERHAGSEPIH
ncbi:hypothetical protein K438DRAFT_1759436 [Mycena galopus ATCC 62051]|nr:hypothetical protein K438DRAFT_1759436 [Mycena galopus ATCC 62051]